MKIEDWTPSHSGPWLTVWDFDEEVPHVVPGFGPKHIISRVCWCHPVLDSDYTETVVSHNVAQ